MSLMELLEHSKTDQCHEEPQVIRSFIDHCKNKDTVVNIGKGDKYWSDCKLHWLDPAGRRAIIGHDGGFVLMHYDWIEVREPEA